jgi:hypothetical protein
VMMGAVMMGAVMMGCGHKSALEAQPRAADVPRPLFSLSRAEA